MAPTNVDPGECGHCGSADCEPQNYATQCHTCGKWSEMDGTPIEGNPHHWANTSVSMPWMNNL